MLSRCYVVCSRWTVASLWFSVGLETGCGLSKVVVGSLEVGGHVDVFGEMDMTFLVANSEFAGCSLSTLNQVFLGQTWTELRTCLLLNTFGFFKVGDQRRFVAFLAIFMFTISRSSVSNYGFSVTIVLSFWHRLYQILRDDFHFTQAALTKRFKYF